MFKKSKIKREIKRAKRNIVNLERRRARSQAALVDAILTQQSPDDRDVEYFNRFTDLIESERKIMHNLMKELDNLN